MFTIDVNLNGCKFINNIDKTAFLWLRHARRVCFALSVFHAIWSDSVNAGSDSVSFGELQDPSTARRSATDLSKINLYIAYKTNYNDHLNYRKQKSSGKNLHMQLLRIYTADCTCH